MNNYIPRNLLVTGGAGFIGRNFISHLLQHDSAILIINLDKLTYAGSRDSLQHLPNPERHIFIHGDICDEHLVQQLLQQYNIDTIIHFAAETHVDRSIHTPQLFLETNIMGTFTLLEAAYRYWKKQSALSPQACRFHHISTDEVYGSLGPNDPAFTEESAYAPNSPYSASKAASDHLVRSYYHTYKLPITISHCSNNYGPWQHREKFIPTIITACLQQQPIPVYGNGSNIRDWIHVMDHCAGIEQILRKGTLGKKYNLGSNNEQSNLAIVNYITHYFDQHYPQPQPYANLIQYVVDRPGHDWRYAINSSQAHQELGWQPRYAFHNGIKETIEWFINNPIGKEAKAIHA
ncbi:MAG: dTDP-glucose 4,6-dehydratase [Gammaproteobacteria bacterium RIFCSPHIGHO2_12_FULL_41_20]|nr:MAG: dTDP-glucose 4,6-dehydratase [Gammaproteobacteria bacterium RIFCSPHIGHO2_12_FULL_41_20]